VGVLSDLTGLLGYFAIGSIAKRLNGTAFCKTGHIKKRDASERIAFFSQKRRHQRGVITLI
jgi:hypothetical protein